MTPSICSKACVQKSRFVLRRDTRCSTNSSPWWRATSPAFCAMLGACETVNSLNCAARAHRSGRDISHPRRQPVMHHAFENDCTIISASSAAANLQNRWRYASVSITEACHTLRPREAIIHACARNPEAFVVPLRRHPAKRIRGGSIDQQPGAWVTALPCIEIDGESALCRMCGDLDRSRVAHLHNRRSVRPCGREDDRFDHRVEYASNPQLQRLNAGSGNNESILPGPGSHHERARSTRLKARRNEGNPAFSV